MGDDYGPSLIARLASIEKKLERLREQDSAFSVFGSGSHKYRLRPPISEQTLSSYERSLGASLPIEYRLFVTRVGHGGAGPYHGLFPLDDRDPEDITDFDRTRKRFRWTEAFNPYDWQDPCRQENVWCDDDAEEGEQPQVILNVPGALYICTYGCAIRFFLIVNGESVGEVWRDSQADGAGITPECGEDGRHLGFLDWYENWLDKAI